MADGGAALGAARKGKGREWPGSWIRTASAEKKPIEEPDAGASTSGPDGPVGK